MIKKILAFFILLLFFGTGLVLPSSAKTIEKIEDTEMNNPPYIVAAYFVGWYYRPLLGLWQARIYVQGVDPDDDAIKYYLDDLQSHGYTSSPLVANSTSYILSAYYSNKGNYPIDVWCEDEHGSSSFKVRVYTPFPKIKNQNLVGPFFLFLEKFFGYTIGII